MMDFEVFEAEFDFVHIHSHKAREFLSKVFLSIKHSHQHIHKHCQVRRVVHG